MNLLKQILTGTETIEVSLNKTTARFKFESVELTSRLIDGIFPNYDAVIPVENPNVLTVDRTSFLNALKRVSIFRIKRPTLLELVLQEVN